MRNLVHCMIDGLGDDASKIGGVGNKNSAAEAATLRRFAAELIYWDGELKLVVLVVQLIKMTRDAGTDSLLGTVPLFTPILPPMIHSVSHESLVQ
ncbi:unnamed protein product [Phytophthora fragariaefolia]|uniref:Unnamed protein product n=1 Tax=Phytophthora fragariaefolia TaxID=1490495 RepID=A0A9W7CSJ7_9STRA|nr:unnamed protein product [Phytophthora fragariaefolia]